MERTKQGELTWTDLAASDLEAQSHFYEELFGWDHEDVPIDGGTYRMFHKDGHTVGGAATMQPEMAAAGMPSAWNTYIAADDIDAEAATAERLGGKVIVPPMDVGQRGRIVGIQDTTGGIVYLWKSYQPDSDEAYGGPGQLSWADLETRDPEKAADFYEKLVGWDVQALTQGASPYWQFNVEGQGEGGIMPMPDMLPPGTPAYWLDYFGTDDIGASVQKAQELGGDVLVEPTEAGGMVSFAVLNDPKGATFALMQPLGQM